MRAPRLNLEQVNRCLAALAYAGVIALGVMLVLVLLPRLAEPQYGIRIPPPPSPPVTWTSPRADSTDVPATFLDESDPLHGGNGRPNGVTVRHTAGSGDQCVGLVTWAASIADSIVGTLDSAAVTALPAELRPPGGERQPRGRSSGGVLERVRGDLAQPGDQEALGRPGG